VPQNLAEGIKWWTMSAKQGNREAQYILGVCFFDGVGGAPDSVEAIKWTRKAAEQGHADAQAKIKSVSQALGQELPSVMTKISSNEPEDIITSLECIRKLAAFGSPDGYYFLGVFYHYGRGVHKDNAKTVELWRKAAELGHNEARVQLHELFGVSYE
jgi:TPR repeat protein